MNPPSTPLSAKLPAPKVQILVGMATIIGIGLLIVLMKPGAFALLIGALIALAGAVMIFQGVYRLYRDTIAAQAGDRQDR